MSNKTDYKRLYRNEENQKRVYEQRSNDALKALNTVLQKIAPKFTATEMKELLSLIGAQTVAKEGM